MCGIRFKLLALGVFVVGLGVQTSWARDVRVTLPKHSQMTPVQRLNREGVDAVRKQQYEKAEAIFYKAYLFDPSDPFTLNNLGYISEVQGQLDRALKFYALASQQGSDAAIARSNAKQLEGKPIEAALSGLKDAPLRVNHMNVEAIEMLGDNRNSEAEILLQKALALDSQNAFTMNNLGVAEESLGDYDQALKYYEASASARSAEPIVVTLNRSLRGKPVSDMAAQSARQLRERMQNVSTEEARAAMLTLRGVSATNRNDWSDARLDFEQAYSIAPKNAFSLNNLGYVAEKDGDPETAKFYYEKAGKADGANARVGLSTQRVEEGKDLAEVASDSEEKIEGEIDRNRQLRHTQTGPVGLKRRDGSPANSPAASPSQPLSQTAPQTVPQPATPNSAPQNPPN